MDSMDDLFPSAVDATTVFYARADASGIWLSRSGDGTLRSTSDFSSALACPDAKTAQELWSQLCEATIKSGKSLAWTAKRALLFPGISPDAPPIGLTMFMALCQGRFVCQKKSYTGFDWGLSPAPSEAHIFMSKEAAQHALRSVMPSKATLPGVAILPLRADFCMPLSQEGYPLDGLAASMAGASAKRELRESAPQPEASPKKRKRAGL